MISSFRPQRSGEPESRYIVSLPYPDYTLRVPFGLHFVHSTRYALLSRFRGNDDKRLF